MKAKLLQRTDRVGGGFHEAGVVIEDPLVYLLVQMGAADPADDECRRAANRTPEQMAAAQKAYRRIDAGIMPEDYAAFDAGLMTGYDAEGNWIPGPNFREEEPDAAEEPEDEWNSVTYA